MAFFKINTKLYHVHTWSQVISHLVTGDWMSPVTMLPSFLILRPILRLYNSAIKTPDFSAFCVQIVGKVVHYIRLHMALTLH